MPNVLSTEFIDSFADRSIDILNDTLKAMLVRSGYVPDKDTQFIDTGGASDAVDFRVASSTDQTISGRSIVKDTTNDFVCLTANSVTFSSVPAGPAAAGVVLYKDTGTPTTSKIIGYFDIPDVIPDGGDIVIAFPTSSNGGILKMLQA